MPKFKITIKISQPIEIVYQAYIDPDNMLKWSTDLEKFEIVKGKFGEIGATAHLYYKQNGRTNIMEDRLEFIEPGKKLISSVSGGGLIAKVEAIFISSGRESELEVSWNGTGKNLLVKLILTIIIKKIRDRAQSELDKFKYLVEENGVKFK